MEYGYPTPFLEREAWLSEVHNILEPLQIFSRGRFGGWKYEVSNQDHSLMQGVEIVDRIVSEQEELTYHNPDTVNAQYNGDRRLDVERLRALARNE